MLRRRLFNLVAAVSLVLCVATVALWVRSYWRSDLIKGSRWDYNASSISKQVDERTWSTLPRTLRPVQPKELDAQSWMSSTALYREPWLGDWRGS